MALVKTKKRVIIESPYSAKNGRTVEENVLYAKRCMMDSLNRGEAPILSHLLYTQVLDDDIPGERLDGISAGFEWGIAAETIVFCTDHGMSEGMLKALDYWIKKQNKGSNLLGGFDINVGWHYNIEIRKIYEKA